MKLPRSLSPKAKKQLLTAPAEEPVRCLLRVARPSDADPLRERIERLGGTVHAWMDETLLMTVTLPSGRLGELAGDDAVVYVETGEAYRL